VKEYVLDTHAFIWWTTRPAKLGKAARRALRDVDAGRALAFVPAVVCVELTLLAEAGRKVPAVVDVEATLDRNDAVRLLPLDLGQTKEFALLGGIVDPFDRMVVAAARATSRSLITTDSAIADSGLVDVVWD
jgi:PIN domain nuclease of toxin-antitoxin system